MLEKGSKCDRYVWAMYDYVFDIFGSLDKARMIISSKLEIYVTYAAGT
jgi:hypothetical protein